ncbi:MAG: hypothetical protein IKC61_02035 [Clostridia bacterium]|nr:hypothetical protein [Clostridia bacterium]
MLDFYFEPYEFVKNLKYMGIGMLGVFMIVAVIIIATYLTNNITNKLAKPHDDD